MNRSPLSNSIALFLLIAASCVLVCQQTQSAQGKAEDDVKAAFGQLQGAIKAKDNGKIWDLLDSDSQADAERTAKVVKGQHKKSNEKDKSEQEKTLGLSAAEFAKLDGKLLLKTTVFLAKCDEIPGSKITGVNIQGTTATLNYEEADGDKEKLTYSRQDNKWKVALPMPKFTK
jgi:hypothetical protein